MTPPASYSNELRLVLAASWRAEGAHQESQRSEIQDFVKQGIDWPFLFNLINRHRVPALVHTALRKHARDAMPEAFSKELSAQDKQSRMQALHHATLLHRLLSLLESLHVVSLPLKGVTLSERLYGDIGMRHSKDIDLLVRPADVEAVEEALRELGFVRDPWLEGLRPTPRQEAHLHSVNYHASYRQPQGAELELHWTRPSWSPEHMEILWQHTREAEWMGKPGRQLDDAMLLLFLCDHGAHHRWFRIKWLSDVAMLLSQMSPDSIAGACELARQLDLVRPLTQTLALVEKLYGVWTFHSGGQLQADGASVRWLIDDALAAIAGSEEEGLMRVGVPRKIRFQLRLRRHPPVLEPLQRLLISPYDFRSVPLPDTMFPAYYLLRPVLWFGRSMGLLSGG